MNGDSLVHIFSQNRWEWEQTIVSIGAPLSEDYNQIENCQPNFVVVNLDNTKQKEILFASYDCRMHAYWIDKIEHYRASCKIKKQLLVT